MSLKKCPECGHEMSSSAYRCPICKSSGSKCDNHTIDILRNRESFIYDEIKYSNSTIDTSIYDVVLKNKHWYSNYCFRKFDFQTSHGIKSWGTVSFYGASATFDFTSYGGNLLTVAKKYGFSVIKQYDSDGDSDGYKLKKSTNIIEAISIFNEFNAMGDWRLNGELVVPGNYSTSISVELQCPECKHKFTMTDAVCRYCGYDVSAYISHIIQELCMEEYIKDKLLEEKVAYITQEQIRREQIKLKLSSYKQELESIHAFNNDLNKENFVTCMGNSFFYILPHGVIGHLVFKNDSIFAYIYFIFDINQKDTIIELDKQFSLNSKYYKNSESLHQRFITQHASFLHDKFLKWDPDNDIFIRSDKIQYLKAFEIKKLLDATCETCYSGRKHHGSFMYEKIEYILDDFEVAVRYFHETNEYLNSTLINESKNTVNASKQKGNIFSKIKGILLKKVCCKDSTPNGNINQEVTLNQNNKRVKSDQKYTSNNHGIEKKIEPNCCADNSNSNVEKTNNTTAKYSQGTNSGKILIRYAVNVVYDRETFDIKNITDMGNGKSLIQCITNDIPNEREEFFDIKNIAETFRRRNIQNITIIGAIQKIENGTFTNCTSLESVVIEAPIYSIGRQAFKNCSNLKTVELPNTLKQIEEYAFSGCYYLHHINNIPSSLEKIGVGAFMDSGLTYIDLRDSKLKRIEKTVFYKNRRLDNAEFPISLESVESEAFAYCESLRYVIIPNCKRIGDSAFIECTHLEIDFPNGLINIGDSAFEKCYSLEHLVIPKSTEYINRRAFYNCQHLSSVLLNEGLISIGEYAFSGCSNLEKIIIPQSVKYVGSRVCDRNTEFISKRKQKNKPLK